MTPDPDAFRALARSSPWRWRTLLFRVRGSWIEGEVEAYVARPGRLAVRTADGRVDVEEGLPYTSVTVTVGHDGNVPSPRRVLPHEVAPQLRPDGLVAERPSSWEVDYDDPMWGNYTWVAMLDPVELGHDVAAERVRPDVVAGRPAWRADLRALPGYEPRCGGGCCELLVSEAGRHADDEGPGTPNWRPVPDGTVFPDHHDVALDVQTGVVVRCHPVGGTVGGRVEVDILAVDGPAPSWSPWAASAG